VIAYPAKFTKAAEGGIEKLQKVFNRQFISL